MTSQELIELLDKNELVKQSKTNFAWWQEEIFRNEENIPYEGEVVRKFDIYGDNNLIPVIFHFHDGFIHSPEEDVPAIEYPFHWEYWQRGRIRKIIDASTDERIEEIWENCVPVSIEYIKQ